MVKNKLPQKWITNACSTDLLLDYMAKSPNMQFPIATLENDMSGLGIDCEKEINELIRYQLVEIIRGTGYYPLFRISSLGLTVANTTIFSDYKSQIQEAGNLKREKERLELIKLKREVHLQPWQFWMLILGSLLGIITLVKDWLFK